MDNSNYWPDFNDLWDYSDPAGTEETFNKLLADQSSSNNIAYYLQLQTQIARTYSLRGEFEQAHKILDGVEERMAGDDIVTVRYLLERGRSFNSDGQPEQAIPLFERATIIAEKIGAEYYWIDALHMLGIAALESEQLDWNLKGVVAARSCSDERARNWEGALLNNIGWTYFEQKAYQNALKTFEETATFYEDKPQHLNRYQIAQWSIAKTVRMLDRPKEGLAILRELEAAGKMDGFTEEEIGECLLALDQPEASKPYFKAAHDKLSQISWVTADTKRITRLKQYGE